MDKTLAQLTEATLFIKLVLIVDSGRSPWLKFPDPSLLLSLHLDATTILTYPLPRVDQTMVQLTEAMIFSKLDANSGFWQI